MPYEPSSMRRNAQQLDLEECYQIFERATSGTLALVDENGWPYAVPMSFVFIRPTTPKEQARFIFHCALEGHKLEAIKKNPNASFVVVGADDVKPERYTTYFRSAIAYGTVRLVEDVPETRMNGLVLAAKYRPHFYDAAVAEVNMSERTLKTFVLHVDAITGKEAVELVKQREKAAKAAAEAAEAEQQGEQPVNEKTELA